MLPRVLPGQHGEIHIKGSIPGLVPGLAPGQLVLQLQVRKQVLPRPQGGCQSSLSGSRAEGEGFDITPLSMVHSGNHWEARLPIRHCWSSAAGGRRTERAAHTLFWY